MKLTEEEKQLILKKRIEDEDQKPIKTGILKHNLYSVSENKFNFRGWLFDENERSALLEEFESMFHIISEGIAFDCYLNDGQECWYDAEGIGIEGMDSAWANKHLKDIKIVKKKRVK
ncbi:hypothetical protein UFOVP1290_445 [uncultured Caudovirales phage]|uniref:Uncharacterized protein n=1 Tax=uncultured Caudovirales phage TaxID=2100421 RepID=A0A6J5RXF4_9CAUD|nr:hypothetical protein UFOVP1290_445 [uncultured Caudovirales phage]